MRKDLREQTADNHREPLYRFCVRAVDDLQRTIIPFFREHPLRTAKREDFKKFVQVVSVMTAKRHLTLKGMKAIAAIAQTMNRRKPSRLLESSETIRPTLLTAAKI